MSEFSGDWELVGYAYINDELPLVDGEPRGIDSQSWLLGSLEPPQNASDRSGLRLIISGSRFSEAVAEFPELMFDIEGIQVNDYRPMTGNIHSIENLGFLLPDGVPEYAAPPVNSAVASRYADGDTIVCDTIRRSGNDILRQVSVITDELYIDRVVLVYRCATDT